MKRLVIVTAIVTIVLFSLESFCSYNLIKYNINEINKENVKKMFKPPPFIEIVKQLVLITIFYFISLMIIEILKRIIQE